METRATSRFVRLTAQKARLVVELIRGKPVEAAMAILEFTPKRGAKSVLKTLKSAVANAEQKALQANEPFDLDRLRVTSAIVNAGQTLRRFQAAAQGRGTPIRKRTSHVEITVAMTGEE